MFKNIFKRTIMLLLICWLLLHISGCGQTGPLYLPKQQTKQHNN
jgi:predicted small lipoprotein YifL